MARIKYFKPTLKDLQHPKSIKIHDLLKGDSSIHLVSTLHQLSTREEILVPTNHWPHRMSQHIQIGEQIHRLPKFIFPNTIWNIIHIFKLWCTSFFIFGSFRGDSICLFQFFPINSYMIRGVYPIYCVYAIFDFLECVLCFDDVKFTIYDTKLFNQILPQASHIFIKCSWNEAQCL